jgi:hypothetical protein
VVGRGEAVSEALGLAEAHRLPEALLEAQAEAAALGGREGVGEWESVPLSEPQAVAEAVGAGVEGAGVGLGVPEAQRDPVAQADAVAVKGAEVAAGLGLPEPEPHTVCDTVGEGERLRVPLPEGVSDGDALGVCEWEPQAEAQALGVCGGEEAAGEGLGEVLVLRLCDAVLQVV